MEARIRERFNDKILHEAMTCYAIDPAQFEELPGFESFIYAFTRADGDYILRISHSLRRSVELLHGEADWINYLADGGAGVAKAITSTQGALVEVIDDGQGGQFLATAFVRAPGIPAWDTVWTPSFYANYGRAIGRMHALTKEYTPTDPAWRRLEWDDPLNIDMMDHLPAADRVAQRHYQRVLDHLRALPRGRDSYGMIHQDAHGGNFFIDDTEQITLFDFDDCVYGWFIYDIAMVFFYAATGNDDPTWLPREFAPHFLRGYRQENTLEPIWLAEIPWFLKLREIELYAVIHRSFDVSDLSGDPWVANFMTGRKARIDGGIPYIDFDFMQLAEDLG